MTDNEPYIGRMTYVVNGKQLPSNWTPETYSTNVDQYVDVAFEHDNEDINSTVVKYPVLGKAKVLPDGYVRIDWDNSVNGDLGRLCVDAQVANKLSIRESVKWDKDNPSAGISKKILHVSLVKDPGRGDGMFIEKLGKEEYKQIRECVISASNTAPTAAMSNASSSSTEANKVSEQTVPPVDTQEEEDVEQYIVKAFGSSAPEQAEKALQLVRDAKLKLVTPLEEERKRMDEERKMLETEKAAAEANKKAAEEERKSVEEEAKKTRALMETMKASSGKRALDVLEVGGKNTAMTEDVRNAIMTNPALAEAIISANSLAFSAASAVDSQFLRDEQEAKRRRLAEAAQHSRAVGSKYMQPAVRLDAPREQQAAAFRPDPMAIRKMMGGSRSLDAKDLHAMQNMH